MQLVLFILYFELPNIILASRFILCVCVCLYIYFFFPILLENFGLLNNVERPSSVVFPSIHLAN